MSESTSTGKNEKEMNFLDHLEELRWVIWYSLIGIVVSSIICSFFLDFLINKILLKPAIDLKINIQNLKPFGQLLLYVQVALISGFFLSIPNTFFQLWRFISPALKANEKKYINRVVFFTTFCFVCGVSFAYFVLLPVTLEFAGSFGSENIQNNFEISEYITIVFSVMLACAVIFELPMMSFVLSILGILTPRIMRKYRRHSIVSIFIISAFISPGTDPVAQILMALPLIILYEISILVSKIFQRKSEED